MMDPGCKVIPFPTEMEVPEVKPEAPEREMDALTIRYNARLYAEKYIGTGPLPRLSLEQPLAMDASAIRAKLDCTADDAPEIAVMPI